MDEKQLKEFQNRVLENLKEKVNHHENLLRYTKKSVKRKHHKDNIKFLKEVIVEAKSEYGI